MRKKSGKAEKHSTADWLTGGGEIGECIRAFDWSKTPIGAIESWPPSLRTLVNVLLANRFPLLLWWGSQYISIYNDAYRPILGAKPCLRTAGPRVLERDLARAPTIDRYAVSRRSIHLERRLHGGNQSLRFHRRNPFHDRLQSRSR